MSTQIKWEPKLVKLVELRENLNNPKILNDVGKKRLHKSINKFGPAGTMIVNQDMTIIDGHSRKHELLESGIDEVWVSVPDRMLTEEEYKEMNAVFDSARASSLDMFMVENTFPEEMIEEWDLGEKKPKKEIHKGIEGEEIEPKYPIIPRYDEKYEAIIIVCTNEIDTTFIKNALEIGYEMSYKNKNVRETSVVHAKKFIEKWKANADQGSNTK